MSDSGKIAPTAHYTAYAWHVLGLPYAEFFATPLGRRLFRAYRVLELPDTLRGRSPKLLRTLRNRHRLIDRELQRLQPDLVVELGAGLSRRGLTFALDHGVRYVEIDLPAMVAYKQALIRERVPEALRARLAERFTVRSLDIMGPDFGELLAAQLAGAERPVIVAEGVVGYFEAPLRHRLLRTLHQALPAAGAVLLDLRVQRGQAASTGVLRLGILVATRGRGAAASFADEAEVRALLEDAGFEQVVQLESTEQYVLSGVWRAQRY